ncbi:hypothetical protein Csa_002293 [Cucumis sativus]|nr:hypothetical protein Csa_002293 [Cucumis sativus]
MDGRELFIRLIRVRVRGNIIPCDRIERLTMNFQNQIRIPQTVGLIRDLGLFYIREYLDRNYMNILSFKFLAFLSTTFLNSIAISHTQAKYLYCFLMADLSLAICVPSIIMVLLLHSSFFLSFFLSLLY